MRGLDGGNVLVGLVCGATLAAFVAISGCDQRPECAKNCGKAGVERHLEIGTYFELCECRNGKTHVKKKETDPTTAEDAKIAAEAAKEAVENVVEKVEEEFSLEGEYGE